MSLFILCYVDLIIFDGEVFGIFLDVVVIEDWLMVFVFEFFLELEL